MIEYTVGVSLARRMCMGLQSGNKKSLGGQVEKRQLNVGILLKNPNKELFVAGGENSIQRQFLLSGAYCIRPR
ncbi:MAG: hypothetical protein IPP25_18730 [Saprospiraceae bacterium]|nr:hypothetical protein [Candidatus Opimibacter skivensis]